MPTVHGKFGLLERLARWCRQSDMPITRVRVNRVLLIFGYRIVFAAVHMPCAPCCEEHLYADDDEDGCHGYKACHCRIPLVPERGEAWICKRNEGGG